MRPSSAKAGIVPALEKRPPAEDAPQEACARRVTCSQYLSLPSLSQPFAGELDVKEKLRMLHGAMADYDSQVPIKPI